MRPWQAGPVVIVVLAVAGLLGGCDSEDSDWSAFTRGTKELTLSPDSLQVVEGSSEVIYQLQLGLVPDDTVRVTVSAVLAQAVAAPGTLVYTPQDWDAPREIRVSAVDDQTVEAAMTDTLRHVVSTRDPDYARLPTLDLAVRVLDNDAAGVILSPLSLVVPESDGGSEQRFYYVNLASAPSHAVNIVCVPSDTMLILTPGSITIQPDAWDELHQVTVAALDDHLASDERQALVQHEITSDDPAYDGLVANEVTVIIPDDDVPQVRLYTLTPVVREDQGPITLTASLDPPSASTVTVMLQLDDGQAHAGEDYQDQEVELTFPPLQTLASVQLDLIDDALPEPLENLYARLAEPVTNAEIGSPSLIELTIRDDERPSLSVADAQGSEADGRITFRISIDPVVDIPVPVTLATVSGSAQSGADFVGLPGSEVQIPANADGVDVVVTVIADGVPESNEYFLLQISAAPSIANVTDGSAIGVILDGAGPNSP